jgi:hypothetical protein
MASLSCLREVASNLDCGVAIGAPSRGGLLGQDEPMRFSWSAAWTWMLQGAGKGSEDEGNQGMGAADQAHER